MDDYIPREAVLELLAEKQKAICPVGRYGRGYVYGRDRDEYDAIEADIDAIENIPAADVAPVRRGKWTLNKDGSGTCSECGRRQEACWDLDGWDNFCHHCGCDMRIT